MAPIVGDLSSTQEDYLEAILLLSKQNGVARVGAIAEHLSVKSPTVNSALKGLSDKGFVQHERYGYVGLTTKGAKSAKEVQQKHETLVKFFHEFLMVDKKLAEKEACLIEHNMSHSTFVRFSKFLNFLEKGSLSKKDNFVTKFSEFLKTK